MPWGLKRYQQARHLHFITFTCYHRAPLLDTGPARDALIGTLERVRIWYGFCVIGYVVMPEHVHLLVSEPERGTLALVVQMIKQIVSRKRHSGERKGPFWQARYYDFNVWSEFRRTIDMAKRVLASLVVALIILGFLAAVFLVGLYYERFAAVSGRNPALASSLTPTSTWKTYNHANDPDIPFDSGFSFQYPPDYTITESPSRHDGHLIGVSVLGPKVADWYQPGVFVTVYPDPSSTHLYENAIRDPMARAFVAGNIVGTESIPGLIMFDTGKKDQSGQEVIIQIGTKGGDRPLIGDVGYYALTERVARTLVLIR